MATSSSPSRVSSARTDHWIPNVFMSSTVVPFGVDHPQVPVLGKALAHAGFVALLYWSSAMRDFRLGPEDIENISLAYDWLIQQPYVDPARSGLLGTWIVMGGIAIWLTIAFLGNLSDSMTSQKNYMSELRISSERGR